MNVDQVYDDMQRRLCKEDVTLWRYAVGAEDDDYTEIPLKVGVKPFKPVAKVGSHGQEIEADYTLSLTTKHLLSKGISADTDRLTNDRVVVRGDTCTITRAILTGEDRWLTIYANKEPEV